MKVKRKYKQGDRVDSVAELLEHDWFIVRFGPRTTKTMHKAVLGEWKLKLCQQFVDGGRIFVAVKLTNAEYYGDMTDDQIVDMLETDLCEYCEGRKGVVGQCDGKFCDEAIEAWKEAYVK